MEVDQDPEDYSTTQHITSHGCSTSAGKTVKRQTLNSHTLTKHQLITCSNRGCSSVNLNSSDQALRNRDGDENVCYYAKLAFG